jgi:Uma2 family endonuclease
LRVWIPEYQCGTYTDLIVVNGKPEFNGDRSDEILNPLLIVEVLSPSTEAYDRGEKFRKYRSVVSFYEYLLVSQNEREHVTFVSPHPKSLSQIWERDFED